MHAANQPCTSATVDGDTAVVGPAFAEGKCILCCIDSDENLQALTVIVIDPYVTTFGCFSAFLRQKQMFERLRRLN